MAGAIISTLVQRSTEAAWNATINPNTCKLDTCPIDYTFYKYRPSIIANSIFLGLFLCSWITYSIQGLFSPRNWAFTLFMCIGCFLETLGYVGRVLSHNDPFAKGPYMLQSCCLTIAPAWLAAGIYLNLSKIVTIFGATISRIKPRSYTLIFVPCDTFSLALQALGGAMASIAAQQNKSSTTGTNIMLAGLSFQVFTLALFIALAVEYAIRVQRRNQILDPAHAKLRNSVAFRGFLVALLLSTLCIFARSVYRVAELSGGWGGRLMRDQGLFVVLEGVMVVVAVAGLNFFHPGCALKGDGEAGGEKEGDDGVAA